MFSGGKFVIFVATKNVIQKRGLKLKAVPLLISLLTPCVAVLHRPTTRNGEQK